MRSTTHRGACTCAATAAATCWRGRRSRWFGARACSPYGAQVARMLGRDLAAAGVVVVRGLARGVDGEAHRGALQTDGHTVAVLGCGIDSDYPAAHARLAREICERSLIVSEYEAGVAPAAWQFPARNRIIAGLCAATVVVVNPRPRNAASAGLGIGTGDCSRHSRRRRAPAPVA